MPTVTVTKKDVIWSYVAQIFNVGTGVVTLPLILRLLSAPEIGMNYLMLTISTLVGLLDFGFAPQFARNITYVFAGAHEIKKEGIAEAHPSIDFCLLKNMIGVAKMVYSRLAIFSLVLMLTLGTWYIYYITNGFTNVKNSLLIWILYSISVSFNIFFFYYSSLLTGRGMIMEVKKALIAQKLTHLFLSYILLLSGCGLLGVVIANLCSPFVGRFLSFRYFYDKNIRTALSNVEISHDRRKDLFGAIWFNAKKLGLVFLGSYAINKFGMFIAGLFLSLEEIASYGLMLQLFSIISSTAMTYNSASQPQYASLRTEKKIQLLIPKLAFSMFIYYLIFIIGTILLIILGPWCLHIIRSNAILPSTLILLIYGVVVFLENNHSSFATFIVTGNKIPFVESSIISGGAICILSYLSLRFTSLGILGIVLVQGICQLVYSNWKWPYEVCHQFHVSFVRFLWIGINEMVKKIS